MSGKHGSWLEAKALKALEFVQGTRDAGIYPHFRPFESGGLHTRIHGKPILNFSSNDYLGLTHHPKVKEAALRALETFGCGLSSSRVQATTTMHVEFEERLARWLGYPRALVFTTGYQAMLGTLQALVDSDVSLVLDNLSHACILDGSFLAAGVPGRKVEVRYFKHNSLNALERCLSTRTSPHAIVVIESIYSLDGDTAPIRGIVEVCERHDAILVCDDAHGTGTVGATGKGIVEACGAEVRVPILVSAMSKTFGGIGGIVAASDNVIDQIKHAARSFLFSASLPVPIVATALAILEMLETEGAALVQELHEKATFMRRSLTQLGFDLGSSDTHIMPVLIRELLGTMAMHERLLADGILMVPVTYPGVQAGAERLRLNVTRGHTRDDLERGIEGLAKHARALGLLRAPPAIEQTPPAHEATGGALGHA